MKCTNISPPQNNTCYTVCMNAMSQELTLICDCGVGVIIAGLEESEYEVNESELSLSICAIQLASIERDVGVIFFTESQSATCKL